MLAVVPPSPSDEIVVRGVVKSVAATPQPGSVPFKDCIIGLRLVGVKTLQGSVSPPTILVYVWGMKNNHLTEASTYAPGQTLTFILRPCGSVETTLGGYNRRELGDSDAMLLEEYWGTGKR